MSNDDDLRRLAQKSGWLPPYTDTDRISKSLKASPLLGKLFAVDYIMETTVVGTRAQYHSLWCSGINKWQVDEPLYPDRSRHPRRPCGYLCSWSALLTGNKGLALDVRLYDTTRDRVLHADLWNELLMPNDETKAMIREDSQVFIEYLRKIAVFELRLHI